MMICTWINLNVLGRRDLGSPSGDAESDAEYVHGWEGKDDRALSKPLQGKNLLILRDFLTFVFESLLLLNLITFRMRSLRLPLRRSFTIPTARSLRGVRRRRAIGKRRLFPIPSTLSRKRVSTKLSDSREIASKNCICCALLSRSVGLCHLSLLSPRNHWSIFLRVAFQTTARNPRVPFAPIYPRNSFLNSRSFSLSWNATVPCSWRHFALLNQARESVDWIVSLSWSHALGPTTTPRDHGTCHGTHSHTRHTSRAGPPHGVNSSQGGATTAPRVDLQVLWRHLGNQ